ncbi:nucleoside phosphatase family-domain-containing protein [Phlyctochytrium arcticum]|nr:nucleoside phosphatase family-domain-containing protein [Phlyctochytrium arcticum]
MQRTSSFERVRGLNRPESPFPVHSPSPLRNSTSSPIPVSNSNSPSAFSSSLNAKLAGASQNPAGGLPPSTPPLPRPSYDRNPNAPLIDTGRILSGTPSFGGQKGKFRFPNTWVSARHWLVGGRRGSKLILLLIFIGISVLTWILIWPNSDQRRPSEDEKLPDLSDLPPPASPVTGPDQRVLNLDIPFQPYYEEDEKKHIAAWKRNRQYGIVIDAGSSGSRVQIYSWQNPTHIRKVAQEAPTELRDQLLDVLPAIEKGEETGEHWQMKEEPGISTFATSPNTVGTHHLKPLLDFANATIPERRHAQTPIYLLATAGMRLVDQKARDAVLQTACDFVRQNYKFSIASGCDMHFRVISGELEGIYGWLTVNYLKGGFDRPSVSEGKRPSKHTYGFLDMGGASTQIAFEPTTDMAVAHSDDLTDLKLRFLGGVEHKFKVFVTTFLGFGMNEARRRYLEGLIAPETNQKLKADHLIATHSLREAPSRETTDSPNNTTKTILDPCLPKGLILDDKSHSPPTVLPVRFQGTGDFSTCMASQLPLLNKSLPCPDMPCLFNGVHAPISNALHFLGVSEYWYTSSQVYGLGGAYDHKIFLKTTEEFCTQEWSTIEKMFNEKKYTRVSDLDRLHLQCFKSAWIMNVLHEGLGVPRERVRVPGDEDEGGSGVDVSGEGASNFESVDQIGNFGVSWTLGAILLHVVATIPNEPVQFPRSVSFGAWLVGVVFFVVVVIYFMRRMKERRKAQLAKSGYGLLGENDEVGMRRLDDEAIDIVHDGGSSSLNPWQDNAKTPMRMLQ